MDKPTEFALYISALVFFVFMLGLWFGGRHNPLSIKQYRKPRAPAQRKPKPTLITFFVREF